jgi:hypothetical protein
MSPGILTDPAYAARHVRRARGRTAEASRGEPYSHPDDNPMNSGFPQACPP